LFQATRDLALVDSAVSDREGAVLELGDGRKYSCCSENEFAFVPTREALIRILNHVGFSKVEPWLPVDPDVLGAYGPSGHRVLLLAQR
jgi:hypothetical protein